MPVTYTPIASQTLTTTPSSVTFSSIPQTYTDLILVTNCAVPGGANSIYFQVNGDTGNNYSNTLFYGNGTTATAITGGAGALGLIAYYATPASILGNANSITHFMNYSNTTTLKTSIGRANAIGSVYPAAETMVTLWNSTSAINSITLLFSAGGVTFTAGSTFTLYGIKAA
jgi:hypothetical protein